MRVKYFGYIRQGFAENRTLWLIGMSLALLATFSGVALLAVSGWFITATGLVSLGAGALSFNYLLPSAVVRLLSYIRILSRYGERYLNHDVLFRLMASLRETLFLNLAQLPFIERIHLEQPRLINRFMSDLTYLEEGYLRGLLPYITGLFLWLIVLCFGLLYLPWLIPYWLGLGLGLLGLVGLAYRSLGVYSAKALEAMEALRAYLFNTVRGVTTFAVYGLVGQERGDYRSETKAFDEIHHRLGIYQISFSLLTLFLTSIILLLVFNKGLSLFYLKPLACAPILVLIVLAGLGLEEFFYSLTQGGLVALYQAKQAGQKIQPLFIPLSRVHQSSGEGKDSLNSLRWEDLSYTYPNQTTPLFKGLSGQLERGKPLWVQGESGRGKTTFLYVLAGLLQPLRGKIWLDNNYLSDYNSAEQAALIGIGWQQPYVFDMTLRENLLLAAPQASEESCWEALARVALEPCVRGLPQGLDTPVGTGGVLFSTGQSKRLDLARLLLKNPPLLLLDEPSEGLDFKTEAIVMANLIDKYQDKLLLIVSHRPAVGAYCPEMLRF